MLDRKLAEEKLDKICARLETSPRKHWTLKVTQIIRMTQGTTLLEQSSLAFHYHICCFISQSAVKFLCVIIVVQV